MIIGKELISPSNCTDHQPCQINHHISNLILKDTWVRIFSHIKNPSSDERKSSSMSEPFH